MFSVSQEGQEKVKDGQEDRILSRRQVVQKCQEIVRVETEENQKGRKSVRT